MSLSFPTGRAADHRVDVPNGCGGTERVGQIGIRTSGIEFVRHDPATSVVLAAQETWQVVANTFTYLGRIADGRESGDQLSGPLGIAKISGDVAKASWLGLIQIGRAPV